MMNQKIKITKLMKLLRNTEDESGEFTDTLSDLSDGARYLYDNVLQPLMNDIEMSTQNLDMDRFEQEDINTILSFYTDNYTIYSKTFSQLLHWYNTCCLAPAVCVQTAFL